MTTLFVEMMRGSTGETRPFDDPREGWILYDGACGFCSRWVPFWAEVLRKRGFAIAPLQTPWVGQRLGMDGADLVRDLRLLFKDGRHVDGADVYRQVMRCIPWAYPIYALSVTPGLSRVFDWGYRTFARNRYRVSRACRLPAAMPEQRQFDRIRT